VIVAKTIASAAVSMTAAAGMRAGGKPRTSNNKEDSKNSRGVTQHWRDLFEILLAFISIQRPLSIRFPHKRFGKRFESSNTQCNRLPDIAALVNRCGLSVERRCSRVAANQRHGLTLSTLKVLTNPPPIRSAVDPRKAKRQFN
jgi:hypothetical protein